MNDLLKLIQNSKIMTPLQNKKGFFVIDDTIGVALVASAFFMKKHENCIVFASNMYSAQQIFDVVSNFVQNDEVLLFPNDELLRSETLTSSKEFLSQRLYVLNCLLNNKPKLVIAYPASIMRYLPSVKEFRSRTINIQVGSHHNLSNLKEFLFTSGYVRVSKIDQSLQYASRGNILDLFSVNCNQPVRIYFNNDEVESIKYFDIVTQESRGSLDNIEIIPATDTLYDDAEIELLNELAMKQIQKDAEIVSPSVALEIKNNFERDYELLKSRQYSPSLYRFYGYAKTEFNSIIDYVKPSVIIVANKKQFNESSHMLYEEANQYLNELFEQGRILSHLSIFQNPETMLHNRSNVVYGISDFDGSSDYKLAIKPIVCSGSSFSQIEPTIRSYISRSKKVIISLSNFQQYNVVLQILDEAKIEYSKLSELSLPTKQVGLLLQAMKEGFELSEFSVSVLTSLELFGQQYHNSRLSSRFKEATILKTYDDLNPGDYIVHEFHGIGQYIDIKTIEVDGIHRDFLHILYAGSDVLYVPLSQFRLVRKYAGREGAVPKLSHLNSGEWEKRKSKIKKRVNELAEQLLILYKERIAVSGYAFPADDELQKLFENSFEYELTNDQKKAIEEIKRDMEKPHPMDRLLCGDVGFGKTEVAFTAAFKAINSGKQVAILCPTTLLARQHYEVAHKRFDQFGIRIAIFSRLIPNLVQKEYIEKIAKGEIDLIIGTHRLLSKEIKYKELGLLIVDEEQRFGVEQKERIKAMKTNVDVLTLSATPIPRTLQMSLVGLRQFSQINTAPENRNPIQTYVIAHKDDVIKELIERELARNGQVFYVYNKVSSIRMIASKLQSEIKGAKIGVVHGQMQRDDIEDVMMRFYSGELNILVCTSIIENGIDIQNANMIIIEDADTFGLAQLYQIKGRVGRGNRIAYAYLLYRPYKEFNNGATKRLKAIQEFTELGSGYKIAQRDLMIRGAGDILGPEQAGYIDSIGIDLYLKLLNEAIAGKSEETRKPITLFNIDAYIPQEYADKPDKIEIYQEIENAKSPSELEQIKKRMRDIYGKIPNEVLLLIKKRRIDMMLESPAFEKIDESHEYVDVSMSIVFSTINGIGSKMFDLLISHLDSIKVTYVNRILKIRLKKNDNWIDELDDVLRIIIKLFEGSVK